LDGNVLPYGDKRPEVSESAFVAPGAYVIGAAYLGEEASLWYGAVLRGDTESIRIGARTNVQDGCVVGHKAVVHGCEIGDRCLLGINATILNGAKIGEGSIVAAGAVVPEGKEFPPRSLVVGVPAKQAGEVTEEQTQDIARGVQSYVERAAEHREALQRTSE
jgi:carbonic anhydrase/acetyltransferase-like protein (isoleucine patch superfamily)